MKRALAILLLITFAFNFIGVGFVYNAWLISIKQNVKQKIKKEYKGKKTVVKIPKSWSDAPPADFKWHEEREFEYRGQMYDVIKKETHGDEIWYYCHWDKAETKLLNNLSQYVTDYLQQHPSDKQKESTLQAYLDKLFLASGGTAFLAPLYEAITFFCQQFLIQTVFGDVDAPPPKKAMSYSLRFIF